MSFKGKAIGTALGAAVGGAGNALREYRNNPDATAEDLKRSAAKGAMGGGAVGFGTAHVAGKTNDFLKKKYGPQPKDSTAYKAGKALRKATKAVGSKAKDVADKFTPSSVKMNREIRRS